MNVPSFVEKSVKAQRLLPLCLCTMAVLVLGVGTVNAQSSDMQARIKRLENEIDTLNRAVYKGERPPAPIGGDPAAEGMETRLTQLEKDLRDLTGKVEQQSYDNQQILQRLDALEQDARMRLDTIEKQLREGQGAAAAPVAGQPPLAPQDTMPPPQDAMPPQPGALAPEDAVTGNETGTGAAADAASLYEQGFAAIKQEDYASAEKTFAQFMKEYPTHALAPNALYWLGETFYVRKEYDKASRVFAEAYQKFPGGPKGADNLLKLGMSLAGKGEKNNACIALGQLKKEFPNGPAPVLARGDQEMAALGCS